MLDAETRELLRGDAPLALSPKAFELLCLLVANRPKAMAKSDLLERLWPSTFVVEKNLANLIGEIRNALGDDPSNPQFIRTVHRFGYAFRETATHPGARGGARRPGDISFVIKSASHRVQLDEGDYVVGRDPDAEICLESPGVSRRHAGSPSTETRHESRTLEARTKRSSAISEWTDRDRWGMGTPSASVPWR